MDFNFDPQEDKPNIKPLIEKAEREAKKTLKKYQVKKNVLGYCHSLWREQKRILKEKYNIDWKTPAEMNPNVTFD